MMIVSRGGTGVSDGGIGVSVFVGGMGVSVLVGGIGVSVFVGGTGVSDGGIGVSVKVANGTGVSDGTTVGASVGVLTGQGVVLAGFESFCNPATDTTSVFAPGCVVVVIVRWPGLPAGTVSLPACPVPAMTQVKFTAKALLLLMRQRSVFAGSAEHSGTITSGTCAGRSVGDGVLVGVNVRDGVNVGPTVGGTGVLVTVGDGGGNTVMVVVAVLVPPGPETVSVTK